jgi:glutamyl-tRNA synthetase
VRLAVEINRERARTTHDIAERAAVRLDRKFMVKDDAKAQKLIAQDPEGFRSALRAATQTLESVPESKWRRVHLESVLRELAESLGLGAGKVFQPIRVALTGTTVSEPVNVLLFVVGKRESLERMRTLNIEHRTENAERER